MNSVPEYHVTNWQVGMACRVNGWNPACKFRIRSFQKNGKVLLDGIVYKRHKPIAVWPGQLLELNLLHVRDKDNKVIYKASKSFTQAQMEELYAKYPNVPMQLKLF